MAGRAVTGRGVTKVIASWLPVAAWLSVVGLVLASWTPGEYMIRTGGPGRFEHATAYFISTLLWVTAYPRWSPWLIGGALALCAGVLEFGQIYIPGRHSQFEDFLASSFGVAIVVAATLRFRRPLSTRPR